MVEGGKVFGRASAAGDDDDVYVSGLVEVADAGGDFAGRGLSLHLRGIDENADGAVAAMQDVQQVAQGRGLRRGDDGDTAGKRRDRLFTGGIEQAFGLKPRLQLFEGDLQRAGAFGFQVLGGDLQFAAAFIDGDAAADDDLHSVVGAEAQQPGLGAEHHDTHLRGVVFQGEVEVAGLGGAEVRNLAFHPGIAKLAFQAGANVGDQGAYRPDTAFGSLKFEAELVEARHDSQCIAGRGGRSATEARNQVQDEGE